MANWDKRFMDLAAHISEWSKDRSTKVGCVIVGPQNEIRSTGYNGFPRGVNDDLDVRHERPLKYSWSEHAERNSLYHAARFGIPVEGCKLYVHPLFPCVDCARAIVQAGISNVIADEPDWEHERWGDSFKITKELFDEVGLKVEWYINNDVASKIDCGNWVAEVPYQNRTGYIFIVKFRNKATGEVTQARYDSGKKVFIDNNNIPALTPKQIENIGSELIKPILKYGSE